MVAAVVLAADRGLRRHRTSSTDHCPTFGPNCPKREQRQLLGHCGEWYDHDLPMETERKHDLWSHPISLHLQGNEQYRPLRRYCKCLGNGDQLECDAACRQTPG